MRYTCPAGICGSDTPGPIGCDHERRALRPNRALGVDRSRTVTRRVTPSGELDFDGLSDWEVREAFTRAARLLQYERLAIDKTGRRADGRRYDATTGMWVYFG